MVPDLEMTICIPTEVPANSSIHSAPSHAQLNGNLCSSMINLSRSMTARFSTMKCGDMIRNFFVTTLKGIFSFKTYERVIQSIEKIKKNFEKTC